MRDSIFSAPAFAKCCIASTPPVQNKTRTSGSKLGSKDCEKQIDMSRTAKLFLKTQTYLFLFSSICCTFCYCVPWISPKQSEEEIVLLYVVQTIFALDKCFFFKCFTLYILYVSCKYDLCKFSLECPNTAVQI